ncbi:MAG: sugar-binding protein [Phocaeicola sp.]|uniref:sugar-binding protein n=1 Tax=Phocaeicola TaxID=909656 RepID=UPI00234F57C6|nr:sugar-binding protein [Phocaeicola oris]MCE2616136.1 hypothetical protein [Phocaeicola oris]
MRKNKILTVFLSTFLLTGCTKDRFKQPFEIPTLSDNTALSEMFDVNKWMSANSIRKLYAPWDGLSDNSTFKCFFSSDYFYFRFEVKDDTPTLCSDYRNELNVSNEDRVEIFFSPDKNMTQTYYGAEMDPNGNTLDYSCNYYRKFNYDWNFNTLDLKTQKDADAYVLIGRIEIKELEKLGVNLNAFYMGVFRADYYGREQVHWYSAQKTDDKEADFHKPNVLFEAKKK